ncbi:hypothetical protein DFJ58DRAFT_843349 [Suillus subalutaceus]|uniref:uncharacterized protein n=1 Tax=Suillus subalutaceus TaxID=48586 RepID=UPI001B87593D|nr:uncharacterized protein DFJ58DRAFT_843349 [Suillus subalutaceus]KAG1847033.1 hypothetical protein DFJ58DRAFT_843349 [Suillus subalutaceus]
MKSENDAAADAKCAKKKEAVPVKQSARATANDKPALVKIAKSSAKLIPRSVTPPVAGPSIPRSVTPPVASPSISGTVMLPVAGPSNDRTMDARSEAADVMMLLHLSSCISHVKNCNCFVIDPYTCPYMPAIFGEIRYAAAKLKRGRQSSPSIEILSDKEHKPPVKKLKVGIMVKQEDLVTDVQARTRSVVDAASQPKKQSSNADIDELPNVIRQLSLVPQTPQQNTSTGSFSTTPAGSHFGTTDLLSTQFRFPGVQLRRIAMPPDFVEPQPSDIILRGIRDPDSPSAPPRINPWLEDYFIGDVDITI